MFMSNDGGKTLRELTEALIMRDQQLIESEETFRTLFSINPVPMCLTDTTDGKFIRVNKSFEDLSGFLEEEVLGKSALELEFYHTPMDRKQITDLVAGTGAILGLSIIVKTRNGKLKETEFSVTVVSIQEKKYFMTVIVDVTNRNILNGILDLAEQKSKDLLELADLKAKEILSIPEERAKELVEIAAEKAKGVLVVAEQKALAVLAAGEVSAQAVLNEATLKAKEVLIKADQTARELFLFQEHNRRAGDKK